MKFLILIFLLFTSCVSIYNKSLLSVNKLETNNRATKLNLQGYYYFSEGDKITPMLLYENGYMHEIFTYSMDNDSFEKSILTNRNYFNSKNKKNGIWGWGIWWTKGDSIFIEQYDIRSNVGYDLRFRKGRLLNDTTFRLTSDYSEFQEPKLRTTEKEYRFRHYSPKPDSSNYIESNISLFGSKNSR